MKAVLISLVTLLLAGGITLGVAQAQTTTLTPSPTTGNAMNGTSSSSTGTQVPSGAPQTGFAK